MSPRATVKSVEVAVDLRATAARIASEWHAVIVAAARWEITINEGGQRLLMTEG